jgi:hypothetical protein
LTEDWVSPTRCGEEKNLLPLPGTEPSAPSRYVGSGLLHIAVQTQTLRQGFNTLCVADYSPHMWLQTRLGTHQRGGGQQNGMLHPSHCKAAAQAYSHNPRTLPRPPASCVLTARLRPLSGKHLNPVEGWLSGRTLNVPLQLSTNTVRRFTAASRPHPEPLQSVRFRFSRRRLQG